MESMNKHLQVSIGGIVVGLVLKTVFSAVNYFFRIRGTCETLSTSPVGTNCPPSVTSYVISGLNPFSGFVFWIFLLIGLTGAYIYFYRL